MKELKTFFFLTSCVFFSQKKEPPSKNSTCSLYDNIFLCGLYITAPRKTRVGIAIHLKRMKPLFFPPFCDIAKVKSQPNMYQKYLYCNCKWYCGWIFSSVTLFPQSDFTHVEIRNILRSHFNLIHFFLFFAQRMFSIRFCRIFKTDNMFGIFTHHKTFLPSIVSGALI